jgi:cytochrome c-type biogenesis protein CcmH/NrfG
VLAAAPDHAPSLLALARLALALGDVAACQARCLGLLRVEPENESAASMLAEIMFHQASGPCSREGCSRRAPFLSLLPRPTPHRLCR